MQTVCFGIGFQDCESSVLRLLTIQKFSVGFGGDLPIRFVLVILGEKLVLSQKWQWTTGHTVTSDAPFNHVVYTQQSPLGLVDILQCRTFELELCMHIHGAACGLEIANLC